MEPSSEESDSGAKGIGDDNERSKKLESSDTPGLTAVGESAAVGFPLAKSVIFYSFVIATLVEGFIHYFFTFATESYPTSMATVIRARGIHCLTLAILSSGIVRSLNGKIDLLSVFLFATYFHCTASLGNLSFSVSSLGSRGMNAFEWIKMVFYATYLLVSGGTQGRGLINRMFVSSRSKN